MTDITLVVGEPVSGGVSRLSTLLANEMSPRHNVTMLATKSEIPYDVHEEVIIKTAGKLLYAFGLGHAVKNLLLFPLRSRHLNSDIVVNLSGSYAATVLLDQLGVNAVHFAHSTFKPYSAFPDPSLIEKVYGESIAAIQDWAVGKQVPVVCNSRRTKENLENRYDIAAYYSYPPVDVERFTPSTTRQEYVLVSGRFHPDKHIERVLEKLTHEDIVVAGAATDEAYYEQLQNSFPDVDFRRDVPEDEWTKLHQEAGVYVFPNPKEHFGIVPAEAMSCGVPTIVPEGAGIAELIEDRENGYLVDAGMADLTETVAEAITAPEGLRQRARDTIRQQCSPQSLAADIEQAISVTLGDKDWAEVV